MSEDQEKRIEEAYLTAIHFKQTPDKFVPKILEIFGEDESRSTRSKRQSRARWQYLTLVAMELNDRGEWYEPPHLPMPIKWNKDLLYHIYWQTLRYTMYPEKKRQLNTKEFYELIESAQMLFAQAFDIHIPFPNERDFHQEMEHEAMKNK